MARFEHVLLVDDNEIDNFINERIIVSSGFSANVVVKFSADAALDYLREASASAEQVPDVIFLDLNMPVKDGFGFLNDFAQLNDTVKSKARVIVLSSSISPDDINRASVNPHVYKYLNKPLSEKYLEAI
ncbi:MAG: response regulator [Bacteroidia bacterium]